MEISVRVTTQPRKKPTNGSTLDFGQIFSNHMFLVDWDTAKSWHNARIEPYGFLTLDPAAGCLHCGQELFVGLNAYHGIDGGIYLYRASDNFNGTGEAKTGGGQKEGFHAGSLVRWMRKEVGGGVGNHEYVLCHRRRGPHRNP